MSSHLFLSGRGILVVLDFCPWKEMKMLMQLLELLTRQSGMVELFLLRNRRHLLAEAFIWFITFAGGLSYRIFSQLSQFCSVKYFLQQYNIGFIFIYMRSINKIETLDITIFDNIYFCASRKILTIVEDKCTSQLIRGTPKVKKEKKSFSGDVQTVHLNCYTKLFMMSSLFVYIIQSMLK